MKRLIPLFLVLFSISYLATGQDNVLVDNQNFTITGVATDTDLSYYVKVKNNGSEPANIFWSRRYNSGPTEWLSWICDANLCYEAFVNSCPANKPNIIQPGDSISIQLHMNPRLVDGIGTYDVIILDEEGNILSTVSGQAIIGTTSTSGASGDPKLSVYPNPTDDYFQISGISGLKQVEVFNIVGTKVKTYDAAPSKQYFVGDLSEGMYLVRMISSSKKILKTVRLSVR